MFRTRIMELLGIEHPIIWALSLGFFTSVFANSAFVVFQNVRMQELGYSAQVAVNFFGFQFITNTTGRLLVSVLGDRFTLRWQMAVCSLGMTLGVLAFTYAPPQADPCIWAWAVLWGVSFGYLVPMLGAVRGGLFWPGCLWQDLRHHHLDPIHRRGPGPSGGRAC